MEISRPSISERSSSISSTESSASDPFLDPSSPLDPAYVPLEDIQYRAPKPINNVIGGFLPCKVNEPSNVAFLKATEDGRRCPVHKVTRKIPRNTLKGRFYRVFGKTESQSWEYAPPIKAAAAPPPPPKEAEPEPVPAIPKAPTRPPARTRRSSYPLISRLDLDGNYVNSYDADIASDKAEQAPFTQYLSNGRTCFDQGLLACKRTSLMDDFKPAVKIESAVCTCHQGPGICVHHENRAWIVTPDEE